MALVPLATAADLEVRGVDVSNGARVARMLVSASEAVREAAGCAITSITSTLTVLPNRGHWLDVPGPVTAVAALSIDGTTVTDYSIIGGRVWRECGWLTAGPHAPIVITFSHGIPAAPEDIVDLVCSLAAAGMAAAEGAYDPHRSLAYERIDDYQRGFRQGGDEVVSPMILPQRTRDWLRARFGNGVAVTGEI